LITLLYVLVQDFQNNVTLEGTCVYKDGTCYEIGTYLLFQKDISYSWKNIMRNKVFTNKLILIYNYESNNIYHTVLESHVRVFLNLNLGDYFFLINAMPPKVLTTCQAHIGLLWMKRVTKQGK